MEQLDLGFRNGVQSWLLEVEPGKYNVLRRLGDLELYFFADAGARETILAKWNAFCAANKVSEVPFFAHAADTA